jgi:uncharacterized cupredoxin-like copper-binding protein
VPWYLVLRSVVTSTLALAAFLVLGAWALSACEPGPAPATPPIVPGRAVAPREVNLIAKDYSFVPATLDLVPGETLLLHVINGGLEVHEAIIGDAAVQDAWEAAEAAVAGAAPGPTPVVTVPAAVTGVRIVVRSGERVDLRWVVPAGGVSGVLGTVAPFIVGCHIPGHWERGMQMPLRWVKAP